MCPGAPNPTLSPPLRAGYHRTALSFPFPPASSCGPREPGDAFAVVPFRGRGPPLRAVEVVRGVGRGPCHTQEGRQLWVVTVHNGPCSQILHVVWPYLRGGAGGKEQTLDLQRLASYRCQL